MVKIKKSLCMVLIHKKSKTIFLIQILDIFYFSSQLRMNFGDWRCRVDFSRSYS